MRKKTRMGLNIGTSSILLVFVLLCMVTFAALSYVSANGDYKLSRSLADRTAAYYEADGKAEATEALLYQRLSQLAQGCSDIDAYLNGIPGVLEDTDCTFSFQNLGGTGTDHEESSPGTGNDSSFLGNISWQVSLNDTQILQITLDLWDPFTSDTLFTVSQWQVIQARAWEDHSTMNLYDGS